jgi:ribosome-binding factor A
VVWGSAVSLQEFIKELRARECPLITSIVLSPQAGYAIVYLRVGSEEDRARVMEIAESARRAGLMATAIIERRDASGRRRSMIILREVVERG